MHKEKLQNAPQARGCYTLRETITAAHSLSNLLRLPVNTQAGELWAPQPLSAECAWRERLLWLGELGRSGIHILSEALMKAHPAERVASPQLLVLT